MRGNNGPEEARIALCTLYEVVLNVSVLMSPVTPFITEFMYQNLSKALPEDHKMKKDCVHWVVEAVNVDPEALNPEIMLAVERLQAVVELGRTCRERKHVGLKTPLKSMTLLNKSDAFVMDIKKLEAYLKEELNVVELTLSTDTSNIVLEPTLNFRVLGKKLGKDMKKVLEVVKCLSTEELQAFDNEGKIIVCGYELCKNTENPELSEMSVTPKVRDLKDVNLEAHGDKDSLVIMDFTYDEDLDMLATCRTISNIVQKLRKEAQLRQDDEVSMWASVVPLPKSTGKLSKALADKHSEIERLLRRPLLDSKMLQGNETVVKKQEFEIEQEVLVVTITSTDPSCNAAGDAQAEL